MKVTGRTSRCSACLSLVLVAVGLVTVAGPGIAEAKGLFICSEHHTRQFDAWTINPDGTTIKQATYGLTFATDPAGIAIDAIDPHPGTIIFITSEFSAGIEIVEVPPLGLPISHGRSSGPSNLAGIDIDDEDDIVYAMRRSSNQLYVYKWDTAANTLTQTTIVTLPGCAGAFGIAFDETTDTLWVADTASGVARAYDIVTWTEKTSISFIPSHKPVDIAVDRLRKLVYTSSMHWAASVPGGTGSNLLSKFNLTTRTETTADMGHEGVGISVDEVNGFVYVTGGYTSSATPVQNLEVWNPSTNPWTKVQATGDIGTPAGIAVANAIVNPLNLAKNDVIVGQVYIGSTFTYKITYENTNSFAVNNVTILDTLPPELDFKSASHGGVYNPATHTVLWNIGTVPGGTPLVTIDLVVKVNQKAVPGSTINNYVTIDGDEIPPTVVTDDEGSGDPDDEPGTPIGESIPVPIDIKPMSCPNPFNVGDNGVISVAIVGTEDFDVSKVDPETIRLIGIPPLRWSLEDVCTPYFPVIGKENRFSCTEKGPDGYTDLTLKFDQREVATVLGEVADGDELALSLTGNLHETYGGVPIVGEDAIFIVKKGK